MNNRKYLIVTIILCALVLLGFALGTGYWGNNPNNTVTRVGFVYSEDESTPYTANFVRAQRTLEKEYAGRVEMLSRNNVLGRDSEQPLRDLVREGCKAIFINMDTDIPIDLAREFPDVQFCQVSLPNVGLEGAPDNYHTFNGEIYQARYVSGVAAGMKLRQMLDSGAILPQDAMVGFVGANSSSEVISGYTAFLLGIRSVAPEAVMRVRYTGSWSNYNAEKEAARQLIKEGCVIISQHVNTMASAAACEEAAAAGQRVYHVGYHQSMMDVAPSSALVSIRTNWYPYIRQAVEAVMNGQVIEQAVEAHAHGNDMSAGFESGWVEMLELNNHVAAEGTEAKINKTIENLIKGRVHVFSGNYSAVSSLNPLETIRLDEGYTENEYSSNPSFNYILKDCVIIED